MLESFKEVFRQPDTVIQIGSGISCWSGLPTWKGLLEELADFLETSGLGADLVRQKIHSGHLEMAAGLGFSKLSLDQQADFLRQACRLDTAAPGTIHHKLVTMGPTCFVTTNYDHLLEKSFEQWHGGTRFKIVLNTQVEDQPTIMLGRTTHFLYKVHGDAAHPASIVLTQEQYDSINLHGSLYHALYTLETLMNTRPFVYIGFGLQDADFLYTRGAMQQLFEKHARRSYAIMANVTDEEKEYYLKTKGIHLLSYEVDPSCNPPSHEALLTLLDELRSDPSDTPMATSDEGIRLRLAQHAGRLKTPGNQDAHLPLLAKPQDEKKARAQVEELLVHENDKILLLAPSGGGKSYALKHSAARLAAHLNEAIMQETFEPEDTPIPILADLKLYTGDIVELLEKSLPAKLSLNLLLRHFKPRIFLDAFNEVPGKFLTADGWDKDFSAFLRKIGSAPLIISSRSIAGLETRKLNIYNLDLIDRQFIENKLTAAGIDANGILTRELTNTLQIPFFYKLVQTDHLELDADTGQHTILAAFLAMVDSKFQKHVGLGISLLTPMCRSALHVFYSGEEAFPLQVLENYFADELGTHKISSTMPIDIVHWLINEEFLIPLPDRKISFLHESVTEYLIAKQLYLDYRENPKTLREKFKYKGWDDIVMYTLSLMDRREAEKFIVGSWDTDFEFALKAVKYVRGDKNLLTEKILRLAAKNDGKEFSEYLVLQHLPINETHLPLIRTFVAGGGKLGGKAVGVLIALVGDPVKTEIFSLLREKYLDVSFFRSALGGLSHLRLEPADLLELKTILEQVPYHRIPKEAGGVTSYAQRIGAMILALDPEQVYPHFYDPSAPLHRQQAKRDVLYHYLTYARSENAFSLAAAFLLKGDRRVLKVFDSILRNRPAAKAFDFSIFTEAHCIVLTATLELGDIHQKRAALTLIKTLCAERKELAVFFSQKAEEKKGMPRAALYYCLQNDKFFDALESLTTLSDPQLEKEPLDLAIGFEDVNWQQRGTLIMQILKRRYFDLAGAICFGICFSTKNKFGFSFNLGPIQWWLDWFKEIRKAGWIENGTYLDSMSSVIVEAMTNEKRAECIAEFNNPASPYRLILMQTIIKDIEDLALEDFTPEAIDFLLTKKNDPYFEDAGRIFYYIADEELILNRLLPLYKSSRGNYRKGLESILTSLSDDHGIRYL